MSAASKRRLEVTRCRLVGDAAGAQGVSSTYQNVLFVASRSWYYGPWAPSGTIGGELIPGIRQFANLDHFVKHQAIYLSNRTF